MESKSYWSSLSLSTKIKYILIILVTALFTVFITQNMEVLELDVLFWTFKVRFAFALVFSFLMGVIITYAWLKIKFAKKERIAAMKKKEAAARGEASFSQEK